MIKLSLFQLDPMTAHERYRKEIQALQDEIVRLEKQRTDARKDLKALRLKSREDKRQFLCQIAAEKRKGNKE